MATLVGGSALLLQAGPQDNRDPAEKRSSWDLSSVSIRIQGC